MTFTTSVVAGFAASSRLTSTGPLLPR